MSYNSGGCAPSAYALYVRKNNIMSDLNPFLDPTKPQGVVTLSVIAGMIVMIIGLFRGWFSRFFRWIGRSKEMKKLVLNDRGFIFVFDPESKASKKVVFEKKGKINEGMNANESTWRIKRGFLEIFADDGKIYSRFKFDNESGNLIHTNDSDARSMRRQYFVPIWEKVKSQEEGKISDLEEDELTMLLAIYGNGGKATFSELENLTSLNEPLIEAFGHKMMNPPYRYLTELMSDYQFRIEDYSIGFKITPKGTFHLKERKLI